MSFATIPTPSVAGSGKPHFAERVLAWLIPAVVAITPFVLVYTLERPNLGQGYFLQLAVMGLLALHGALLLGGVRRLPRGLNLPGGLLLANLALLGVAVFGSGTAFYSLKKVLLPLSGLALCAMIVLSPLRGVILRRVGLTLVGVTLLMAVYGVLQYFGVEFLPYSSEVQKNTVIATIGHPNYLASVLGPMVFVTIAVLLTRRGKLRMELVGAACTLILFCVYLARTRAVWLGLGAGFGLLGWLVMSHAMRRAPGDWLRSVARWMGALLLSLLGVILVLPFTGRSVDLLERLTSSAEIKSRFIYWNAAIDMSLNSPLLGQGYARFDPGFWDYVLEQRKNPAAPNLDAYMESIANRTPEHVHNEYLEVMAEQGMPALLALLALLGFLVFFGARAVAREVDVQRQFAGWALLAAMVCMLVDAFFSFPWRLPVSLLVFAYVVAALYDRIYPQSEGLEAPASVVPDIDASEVTAVPEPA